MMELVGLIAGFIAASNSIIFVLVMIESVRELRSRFFNRSRPRQRLL